MNRSTLGKLLIAGAVVYLATRRSSSSGSSRTSRTSSTPANLPNASDITAAASKNWQNTSPATQLFDLPRTIGENLSELAHGLGDAFSGLGPAVADPGTNYSGAVDESDVLA